MNADALISADDTTEYWFNTKTNEVEVGKQSAAIYRIGPFSSANEAANALKTLADRSKAWRTEEEDQNK